MRLWDTRTPLLDLPESVLVEMVRESHLRRGRFAARKRRRAELRREARKAAAKAAKADNPPDPGRFKHRWSADGEPALPGVGESGWTCRNCGAEVRADDAAAPPERGCISPEERRERKAAAQAAKAAKAEARKAAAFAKAPKSRKAGGKKPPKQEATA